MSYDNTENRTQTPALSDADLRRIADLMVQMESARESGPGRDPEQKDNEKVGFTIDLLAMLFFIISKLYFVILGMVVGAVLLGYYAVQVNVPMYTATAKLFIVGQQTDSLVSMLDLQMGTSLTADYQEVFRTWEVQQMVNEELGTNYPYGALQGMLSVSNPENTRILNLTVRHSDAQTAADIANAYVVAAKRFIVESMDTAEPRTFSKALAPTYASSISVTGYTRRGLLLGMVLSVGLLALVYLLDNRPKSTEDILQYGGIPTLAVIPVHEQFSDKKHRSRRRREGKR